MIFLLLLKILPIRVENMVPLLRCASCPSCLRLSVGPRSTSNCGVRSDWPSGATWREFVPAFCWKDKISLTWSARPEAFRTKIWVWTDSPDHFLSVLVSIAIKPYIRLWWNLLPSNLILLLKPITSLKIQCLSALRIIISKKISRYT